MNKNTIIGKENYTYLIREMIQELEKMNRGDIEKIRYLWKEEMFKQGVNKNIEILIDSVCDRVLEN